ncbi:protein FAR1-RELATED SEQUENCE 5-like [Chenopodium quinoa]|uniref:protein FAR1-RELATED SEQUENCE 5-like n=1 Tax=Chenopodium quinoa TaxID=63459 RepID=UPI000B79506D|nr:protein FAR1-RELATED SEQUENCE 5-like [Chenopodium quinoa]
MKELCGGFQNVRGSKNDFKNFSRDLKVYISNADGAMFVLNLEQKVKTSKGGYYFEYCVYESRHLTRVFWAGDSLSFDSTLQINIHWFSVFLLCMGREPSCIITDQDPAMGIAIEKVFTKTKHRLCMWHIMRKVPEKVGTAFCNETDFLKKLSAVVWDREIDPHVFVDGWNSVMEEFNLVDHEWFAYMFKIKHLWIPAYLRDLFMGGLLRSTPSSLYGDGVKFSVIVDHKKRKNFDVNFDLATYESSYVMKKASVIDVALDDASKYYKKKQLVSDVWSKIFSCVSLTDQSKDDLSELIRTLSSFEEQMISNNNPENAPVQKR